MSYPVTGPISESWERRWPPGLDPFNPPSSTYVREYSRRSRYRQAKPYNLVLPFSYTYQVVDKFPSNGTSHRFAEYDAINSTGVAGLKGELSDPILLNFCLERVHGKFKGKIGSSAEWATAFFERKDGLATLVKRLGSFGSFVSKLKKGDLGGAYRALAHADARVFEKKRLTTRQIKNRRRRAAKLERDRRTGWESRIADGRLKRGPKYFASNFLESQFFWAPTISDVYTTIDILQQDFEPIRVHSSHTATRQYELEVGKCQVIATEKVRMGGTIKIDSPNLWLANRLGVINPAVWIYEAVTLSFVANWFVNIKSFLENFTRYAGLSITDAFHTISHAESRKWYAATSSYFIEGANRSFQVDRYIGLAPGPDLHIRAPWDLNPQRAAIAVSLLLQKL